MPMLACPAFCLHSSVMTFHNRTDRRHVDVDMLIMHRIHRVVISSLEPPFDGLRGDINGVTHLQSRKLTHSVSDAR